MTSPKREHLIIADASPLIFLSKLGRLDLLPALAEDVIVPQAVWAEILTGGEARPEAEEIRRALESRVVQTDPLIASAYAIQVDAGEAAALALAATRSDALLLMDDAPGRSVARVAGFRCIGTMGLLLRAKKAGSIREVRPEILRSKARGMFLSSTLHFP